jgi:exonuclease SbcD
MRLLHTSDWHLGRTLSSERLIEDQAIVLAQVVRAVREFRPHAMVISGDVYDRAVPPPEAVELLDEVLSQIVLDHDTHVVLIAGNHDSPQRLTFGARLLARNRLHIAGAFADGNRLRLGDEWGEVDVFALPYLEPALAREELNCPDISDHDSAARAMVGRIRASEMAPRSVLVAHTFVAGGATCDSERPLSLGGAGTVAPDCFDGLSYVALGHLHRAQQAGRPTLRYSGSILKYSFSEAADEKSVSLVEVDRKGECRIEQAPLRPRRDVRSVEGLFDDLMKAPPGDGRNDLLSVTLLDDAPILDPLVRLREVYPNVLGVEQPNFLRTGNGGIKPPGRGLNESELFRAFFSQVTNQELTEEEMLELHSVIEELHARRREAL